MPRCIFSNFSSLCPPPAHDRTTSRVSSVMVSTMRAPTRLGRQARDDGQRSGDLAHLGLGHAVHDVVDVGAARLVPEHLEAGLRPLVEVLGPVPAGGLAQPGGHLGELAQAPRPLGGEQRAGVARRNARPVDQVPLTDVLEHARRGLIGRVPAQDARDRRQPGQHRLAVARVAEPVVDAVDPVQRPIGQREAPGQLEQAHREHRQDAVGARGVAQFHVALRQAPVAVGRQRHHLVHHAVAGPGPLLAGRAVDEGVGRTELHGADDCLEDLVEPRVGARERSRCPARDAGARARRTPAARRCPVRRAPAGRRSGSRWRRRGRSDRRRRGRCSANLPACGRRSGRRGSALRCTRGRTRCPARPATANCTKPGDDAAHVDGDPDGATVGHVEPGRQPPSVRPAACAAARASSTRSMGEAPRPDRVARQRCHFDAGRRDHLAARAARWSAGRAGRTGWVGGCER